MSLSLVAYGESSGSESEPEEEVTSQPTKDDIRNLLSVLPRPKSSSGGGRRSRGPVRIGLPKVEGGVSSDHYRMQEVLVDINKSNLSTIHWCRKTQMKRTLQLPRSRNM